ncbi:MAG TPA: hypothetical protein VFP38_22295, partial [Bradyrhizobium sp.]|nr:hypothetical protein [Bradyrhizobium sp.]
PRVEEVMEVHGRGPTSRAAAMIVSDMAGLVPAIHAFSAAASQDVDARDIQREDALRASARA